MTLVRAPRWERSLVAAVAVLLACSGVAAFVGSASVSGGTRAVLIAMGTATTVVGVALTVRIGRVGVLLSEDALRYRGFLLSWSVPRRQITAVLDDGTVEWRDDGGTEHRRQVWLLTQAWEDDGTRTAPLWRWRREGLLRIRTWAEARAA